MCIVVRAVLLVPLAPVSQGLRHLVQQDAVMKRGRDEGGAAEAPRSSPAAAAPADERHPAGGAAAHPVPVPSVLPAPQCPYLDTVDRSRLDLDFEPRCSVTLSPLHVYACLVCGSFFQGRGPGTCAYTHALEAAHHVFVNTSSGKVYCLPDGYEVRDRSLEDIQHVLHPRYTPPQVAQLETGPGLWCRGLDGAEYLPGLVGLNNLKATDYAAVVLHALNRVRPLRDALLLRPGAGEGATDPSPVAARLSELLRRMWNSRAFKGHVSPHELLRCVQDTTAGKFRLDVQGDPAEFLAWLLDTLRKDGKAMRQVTDACFQGAVRVTTLDGGSSGSSSSSSSSSVVPFSMLSLDLPPPSLFPDALEKNIIPQVPLQQLLAKFDGATQVAVLRPQPGLRTYALQQLPRFLVLHFRRFSRNAFFVEKNPTIVTFPLKHLHLHDFLPLPPSCGPKATYNLVASISHEGKPGQGSYKAHVLHPGLGTWFEASDLSVAEVLPQQVALSEALLQVYERVAE